MKKYIIENGIKYEIKGEQYYPIFSEANTSEHFIGKCRLLPLDYIKQHKKDTYTTLHTEGKLDIEPMIMQIYPLAKIDEAYELFENKRDWVIKVAAAC